MRKVLTATLLAATAMTATPAAFAQSSAEDGVSADEIIVTARRREESLSKVPIAITVISGEDIAKRAIYSENDLQSAVPGLVIRQNGGVHAFNYVVRGQSVDTFSNSPPSVLPYVNEVQIVTHSASTFYDMGGIQVLKGPQGTLFGRNATGGAVLYSTARPTDEFGGYVQGRYSSYQSRHVDGALNIPLGDIGGLRVAGSLTGGGAFVRDYFTGEQYGDLDQKSIRATLLLRPGAGIENVTVVQHTSEDGTNTPYELWSTHACGTSAQGLIDDASCALNSGNPTFNAFLAAHPNVFKGGLEAAAALQRQIGPWQSMSSVHPYHKARSTYAINTTTIELAPELTIKNIFGYNKSKADDGFDYDGSPYHFFEVQGPLSADGVKLNPSDGFLLNTRQLSNELQLQGKAFGGKLDWVVGFYHLNQRFTVESNLNFGDFRPVAAPFSFTYTARTKTTSNAGFAQATLKATDKLSLTGGFRYTWDRTVMRQLPKALWFLYMNPIPDEKAKAHKPSWTVSADYRITPELMIYAAHRGSWRSGGFNYSVFPVAVTAASGGNLFLPETTQDAEVGLKYSGDGLGVPVTFNADVYQQWVKNIQRAAYILTPAGVSLLTVNVPRAKISGFEFDFSVKPTENITLGTSGNYTKARYTSNTVNLLGKVVKYGPFADVPKWSSTFFAELGMPLAGDAGKVVLRGDVYSQSKMAFSNTGATASPGTTLPAYTLVNARLTWADIMGTKLTAALFARNLFNKKHYLGGNAASAGGSTNVVNPGLPRFWGGEVRFEF